METETSNGFSMTRGVALFLFFVTIKNKEWFFVVQKKLYNEMLTNKILDENNLENLPDHHWSKLIYFDAFIKEVLRINPTAIQFVNRRCVEDTYVQEYRITEDLFFKIQSIWNVLIFVR
jgi:hypothetical protein